MSILWDMWKECSGGRMAKRAVTIALAATLAVGGTAPGLTFTAWAESYGKNGTMRDITSQELVRDMGLGYNLGNSFDSIGSWIPKGDPWDYQLGWNNDYLYPLFIRRVKEAGFKTIRFPVSWAQWIDENDQIDPGYMAAVNKVVDWCMDEDLYVILNIHHDSGAADTSWVRKAAADYDWTAKRYRAVWTQIAENFAGYGDHLIFEGMNEVEFPDAPNMSRQYEILNAMNQLFVDTVRATGGNNAVRHLLIPGYNTDIRKTCDGRYQFPDDPAGHCILSIHYYSPSPFAVATRDVDWCTPQTTWGTQEDIADVEADLSLLATHFLSRGVPIIIGEYGVLTTDDKEVESIRAYVRKVPEIILSYGMCPVLWDTSNSGDMKYIERKTGEFYDPVIKANYQELSQLAASGQIAVRREATESYREVTVPASPDGWVSIASFEPSKLRGIKFSVACSAGWDSYGGGGIYLDSYDDTVEWQFNSIYDEVSHIFSDSERARLGDRLGIFIWWTDESQGGSHREELSIKDSQVTLLYGEDSSANTVGVVGSRVSSGGGGGGGGSRSSSGSSSGSGSASAVRPNTTTTPGNVLTEGDGNIYNYVLKETTATDGKGILSFSIPELCPDYAAGDKIKITVRALSDGGYSYGIQNNELLADGTIEWAKSETFGNSNGKTCSRECTPLDGKFDICLWYLGGSYFAFDVTVEKASEDPRPVEPDPIPEGALAVVKNGGNVAFTSEQIYAHEAVEGDISGVKLYYEYAAGDIRDVSANFVVNFDWGYGNDSWETGSDENGDYLWYACEGDIYNMEFYCWYLDSGESILFTDIVVVKGSQEPGVDDPDPDGTLAEIKSGENVSFTNEQIYAHEAVEGETSGVKLYYEYSGGDIREVSGNFVVNYDWNYGTDAWETGSDENGDYLWYACEGDIYNMEFYCWYMGAEESIKFTDIVVVKAAGEPDPDPVGDGEYEALAEADKDGRFWLPDSSLSLVGVKFSMSDGGGLGIDCFPWDGNGTTEWVNGSEETIYYLFGENTPEEYITLSNSVSSVTFLYWEAEDAEVVEIERDEETSYIYALPDYRVPVAMACASQFGGSNLCTFDEDTEKWVDKGWFSWFGSGLTVFSEEQREALAEQIEMDGYLHVVGLRGESGDLEVTFYYDEELTDELSYDSLPEEAEAEKAVKVKAQVGDKLAEGTVAVGELEENTEDASEDEGTTETESSEETVEPGETEDSEETEEPGETEDSKETEEPTETEDPEEADEPGETETPEESGKSDETENETDSEDQTEPTDSADTEPSMNGKENA